MRILGIDPGYGILGWSVIEKGFSVIDYGTVETEQDTPFDDRLIQIYDGIHQIIKTYLPECVAVEKLYFARNTTTALDVSKAIGVVLLAIKQNGLSYTEYAPTQIKQAITGNGHATKAQMQLMIKRIFGIKEIPRPDDAADALAVAACHSLSQRPVRV